MESHCIKSLMYLLRPGSKSVQKAWLSSKPPVFREKQLQLFRGVPLHLRCRVKGVPQQHNPFSLLGSVNVASSEVTKLFPHYV